MDESSFVKHVCREFKENSNADGADKMAAYMKGKFAFYGVSSPVRKELTRELYREYGVPSSALDVVKMLWAQPKRELHYVAQELLMKSKKQWQEHYIEDIEMLITTNSWWDTVDHLASNVVGEYFIKWPQGKLEIIRRWNKSNNMWLVRTSIIFQLKYKDNVDVGLLSECILRHTSDKEFFIRKAIGWSLRQYAKYNQDWVISFLESNVMQPLSRREATKNLGS
jgi:3-methyladenine DNA glycosylase AlkD